MRRVAAFAFAALAVAGATSGQEVRTAVVPDTVTAGQVFRVAIRVIVPRGANVSFPDSLSLPDQVEAAASPVISRDSVDADREAVTATYGLAAWRPGPFALPSAGVRVEIGSDVMTWEVGLPAINVASVLPADTTGIEPRPPRGVLGPDRALLPLLLLAALVGLLAGGAAWILRKRRRRPVPAPAATPPRERALAELDRIRHSGLLESGQYKAFCAAVSEVVRAYLAELQPEWSTDLSTTELAGALRATPVPFPARVPDAEAARALAGEDGGDPAVSVVRLLGAADVVKFTGIPGTAEGADTIWTRARTWVGMYDAGIRRAA